MVAPPNASSVSPACPSCGTPTGTAFCENCGRPQVQSTSDPRTPSLKGRLSAALWTGHRKLLTLAAAVVVGALVTGSVVFIAQAATLPASASMAVSEGHGGSLATAGVRIDFGAHTFSGNGTLAVKLVRTAGGVSEVRVSLTGAKVSEPAQLTFPYIKRSGEPAPLVGHSPLGQAPWVLEGDVTQTPQTVSIKTNHLDTWQVDSWSTVLTDAAHIIDTPVTRATPPVCARTADVQTSGITFTREGGTDATSCVGETDTGSLQAVITNPGALPAVLEESGGLTVSSPNPDYASLGTLFPYIVPKPVTAGDGIQFMPPSGSYTVGVSGAWGKRVLQTRTTGASALAFALLYASGLKDAFAGRYLPQLSARGASKNLASLAATGCLKGLAPRFVDAPNSSAQALADAARTTVSAATGCIPAIIAAQGKQDRATTRAIAKGFAWVSEQQSGRKAERNITADAHTALTIAIPIGYGYIADDPKRYQSSASYVTGIYLITPSQNIGCGYSPGSSGDPDLVGCQIFDYSFTPPPTDSCDGPEAGTEDFYSLKPDGTPTPGCVGGVIFVGPGDGTPVLPYGHSVTYNNVIFVSDSTGLTALNLSTGHGFKLNRGQYIAY